MKLKQGVKNDQGRLPWDLLPPDGVQEIVKVLNHGAKKYEPYNWAKGIAYSRVYAAAQRHLNAFWGGEDKDPDSGLPHLAHALCCILFLQTYEVRRMKKWDNRPKPKGG